MCELIYYFLAHFIQATLLTNPVKEAAGLRSDNLSAAVVGTHNEVGVMMMMSTLTVLDLINYRPRNFHTMLMSSSLLTQQLLLHLLNQ